MNKQILTLGKTNQSKLLKYFGYKTIRTAIKEIGKDNIPNFTIKKKNEKYSKKDTDKTLEIMMHEYNRQIEIQNETVVKVKKNKKQETYYKDNIRVFDYSTMGNPVQEFYNLMLALAGKNIIVEIIDNKKFVKNINVDIPSVGLANWWKKEGQYIFVYPDSIFEDFPNGKLYIYEASKKINSKKIVQYFKEGNVNCLLKPIISWAEGCKEKAKSKSSQSKYNAILKRLENVKDEIGDKGVSYNEMIRISKDAQVDISIEKPIIGLGERFVEESKSTTKPLKHFIMRNTKFNHVELNELLYLNNIENVTRDELYKIKKDLDEKEIYYEFSRDLIGYKSINTLDKTYQISNEFFEMCNQFEIQTGLIDCYVDDIDDEQLSLFIKNGTHYNATVDFQNVFNIDIDEVNHIDMSKAYANYMNCENYKGFLGKITDFRKTDKIVSVGLYQIENLKLSYKIQELNDKLKIYFDYNVYPSCELEWLKDNDCSFDITCGCWGVQSLDFDMFDYPDMFKKYDGCSGYAKYVGKCDSHYLEKKFCCKGDSNLASTIENSEYYNNNEITIRYKKKHNFHLGHFTAFIVAYQRLQMLEQLLNMNDCNIIRICVDGIYYFGDCDINKGFEFKTKKTFENLAGESYVSNIIDYKPYWDIADYRDNFEKELFIGAGGNGKTHKNLTDYGFIKMLYIAPSWKLSTKKRNEYKVDSEVWANILTADPEKYGRIRRRYNVFLIDEVSMMTEENKEIIFDKFKGVKLIFCGDIGYQASPFNTDGKPVVEITNEGFDSIQEEKINYRFQCPILKELIADVRDMINYNRPYYEVNNYVKSKLQVISKDELIKKYKIDDMILSRTHETKDKYTEMFIDMEKWYVTKNTRIYKNGDIIIGNKPDATCEIRHSYTIHSIQGETAEHNLFIDFSKPYDVRLLYTAISRAKKIGQIYCVQ
jgi:hypothetical protein